MQAVVARERSARDGLLRKEDHCLRDCRWELRRELCCWSLGGDEAVLGKHHRRKPNLPIARAWVKLRDCLRAVGLDQEVNMDSGDDADMDAAAHEWLQEWDVPEASSGGWEGDNGHGATRAGHFTVEGAEVISKRAHGDDARRASELVEEEGEAPAAGAVEPTGSGVKAVHTKMLSVCAKNIVHRGCIG